MNDTIRKLSHELKNPLTSLYSTIQLIELSHPEVKEYKYWSNINEDILYINELLNECSNLTKTEELHKSSFSMRTLLEQVSLSFAATIAQSDVSYSSKIHASLPCITGDKTKLQEVFRNLLQNAYEAAAPDNSIYLEAFSQEKQIIVLVRDTGCGIPENRLTSIFEPFVTYKEHGTGLGLSLCQQIVSAHGGTISVKSTLGKGSTFTVTLPINL